MKRIFPYKNTENIKCDGGLIILVYSIHIFSPPFKAEELSIYHNINHFSVAWMFSHITKSDFFAWDYPHATGGEDLNAVSFALNTWIIIQKIRRCIKYCCPMKNVWWYTNCKFSLRFPSLLKVRSTWATKALWDYHKRCRAKAPVDSTENSVFETCSCNQWNRS